MSAAGKLIGAERLATEGLRWHRRAAIAHGYAYMENHLAFHDLSFAALRQQNVCLFQLMS
jgi:hypothetical protein